MALVEDQLTFRNDGVNEPTFAETPSFTPRSEHALVQSPHLENADDVGRENTQPTTNLSEVPSSRLSGSVIATDTDAEQIETGSQAADASNRDSDLFEKFFLATPRTSSERAGHVASPRAPTSAKSADSDGKVPSGGNEGEGNSEVEKRVAESTNSSRVRSRQEEENTERSIEFDLDDGSKSNRKVDDSEEVEAFSKSSGALNNDETVVEEVSTSAEVLVKSNDGVLHPHPPTVPRKVRDTKQQRPIPRKAMGNVIRVRDLVPNEEQPEKPQVKEQARPRKHSHETKKSEKPLTNEQMLAIKYRELQQLLEQDVLPRKRDLLDRRVKQTKQLLRCYLNPQASNQRSAGRRDRKQSASETESESEAETDQHKRRVNVMVQRDVAEDDAPRLLRQSAQPEESGSGGSVKKSHPLESVSYPSPNARLRSRRKYRQSRAKVNDRSNENDASLFNELEAAKAQPKRCDNYLGRSDNPAILKWLRVKNRELKRQRRAERRKMHEEMLLEQFQIAEAERRKAAAEIAYNKWLQDLMQRKKDDKPPIDEPSSDVPEFLQPRTPAEQLQPHPPETQKDETHLRQARPVSAKQSRPSSRPKSSVSIESISLSTSGKLTKERTQSAALKNTKPQLTFNDWLDRKNQDTAKQKEDNARKQTEKQKAADSDLDTWLPDLLKKRHEQREAQKRRVDSGLRRNDEAAATVEAIEFHPLNETTNPYAIVLDNSPQVTSVATASSRKAAESSRDRRVEAITHEHANPFVNVSAPWERPATASNSAFLSNNNSDDSALVNQERIATNRSSTSPRKPSAKLPEPPDSSTDANLTARQLNNSSVSPLQPLQLVSSDDESIIEDFEQLGEQDD